MQIIKMNEEVLSVLICIDLQDILLNTECKDAFYLMLPFVLRKKIYAFQKVL
jgi:hypothetical protein